jgi:Putative Ig domain
MKNARLSFVVFCGLCILNACGGGEVGKSTAPPPVPALAITSSIPPSGEVGTAYGTGGSGFQLSASVGNAPYAWNWSPGNGSSLPTGLTIVNGSIVGTPTIGGDYEVVVTVADSESPAIRTTATYRIAITGPAASLTITSGNPPNGIVGVNYGPSATYKCWASPVLGWHQTCWPCTSTSGCGSLPRCQGFFPSPCRETIFLGFTFTAAGGTSPYNWTASGLPPNLTLDSQTGQITGTPSASGNYSIDVTANDSGSPPMSAAATYDIAVN